jgi:predicted O-linked N-acetylglucosamine transferase (SPINDLY family)
MPAARDFVGELLGLHAAGQFADMERMARALMRSYPGAAILHELLGLALSGQLRHAEALDQLRRAVRIEPNDAQFWENLGLCQRQLEDFDRSEASLRRSLALRPRSVETLSALGSVLRALRRHDEAAEALRQALALDPNHFGARFNLAGTLLESGHLRDAETLIRQVIASNPSFPQAYACLGAILFETGRYDQCAEAAQSILDIVGSVDELSDDKVELLESAANLLAGLGRDGVAAQIYRATLAYRPVAKWPIAVMAAARRVCDWDLADRVEPQSRAAGQKPWRVGPGSIFQLLTVDSIGPAEQVSAARNYAQLFTARSSSAPAAARVGRGRLRIGYLTRDLTNCPVGYLVVGAIEAHDRSRFEVIAYDYTPPSAGAFRSRIESAFERLVRIDALSTPEAAQLIRDDACDIVVDLTGWTTGTRSAILASRPAPVQVQWLGYPGTMGAPWLDYIVADRTLIRPGEEMHYSEKVVRLPHSYQPNDDKRIVATPLSRADYGLPERGFVFCSFNQAYKIGREIFDAWMTLLGSAEGSVLWLLQADPEAVATLQRAAQARGIAPERLIFAPFVSPAEHLARASTADLALDCFPYGSHTTASDMLWSGVPLVALSGETFASRVSASILTAARLPELAVTSIAQYLALALKLADDHEALARLRVKVAQSRANSPLFDTAGFTRGLERAFLAIWKRYSAGLPSDHVVID